MPKASTARLPTSVKQFPTCILVSSYFGIHNCSCAIANTYGVVDYVQDGQETNYGAKIQIFNRFLVENLKVEGNAAPRNPTINPSMATLPPNSVPSPITQLLSINSKSVTVCNHCKRSREKPDTAHIVDMIYPRRVRH